eukprot:6115370-Pleurochrysis_carterae.AAC.1
MTRGRRAPAAKALAAEVLAHLTGPGRIRDQRVAVALHGGGGLPCRGASTAEVVAVFAVGLRHVCANAAHVHVVHALPHVRDEVRGPGKHRLPEGGDVVRARRRP